MKEAKRALAMLALTITVGCTSPLPPATPPPSEAVALQIYSTQDAFPLLQSLSQNFTNQFPGISFEINFYNQNILLEKLENSEINYFVSHHFPTESQRNYWAAPLAQDGIVFVVHPENTLEDVSLEDLRRIYRGYITNWQELGGSDLPITLYSRDEGAGIRQEFERLLMGQERTSPNAIVLPSTQAVLERVAIDLSGIAYLPLSLLDETVKLINVEGNQPSLEAIAENRYPLRTTLYIIGLVEPTHDYLAFIAWTQSNEGQASMGGNYAPLPP